VVTNSRRLIVICFDVFRVFDPKYEVGREKSKRTKCAPLHDIHREVPFVKIAMILKKCVLKTLSL
jgi:hypothetical protein